MLLVAHRGASAYEPENTIRAIEEAFRLGANAVEFDIRQTKDKQVVLMHDARLIRMAHKLSRIRKMTLDQLRGLKVKKSEPIPTLAEALKACEKQQGTAVVEFKEWGLEDEAVKVFRKSKKVLAISYLPEVLLSLKVMMPELSTGLLFKRKVKDIDTFLAWAGELKVNWLAGKKSAITPQLVAEAHKKGFRVMVWVVNRLSTMQKFVRYGVDSLSTNKPDLFTKL